MTTARVKAELRVITVIGATTTATRAATTMMTTRMSEVVRILPKMMVTTAVRVTMIRTTMTTMMQE